MSEDERNGAAGAGRPGTFKQTSYAVVGASTGRKPAEGEAKKKTWGQRAAQAQSAVKTATTVYEVAQTTAGIANKLGVKLPPWLAWLNPEKKKVDDNKPSGPKQYHLLTVPSPDTKVNLGEWVKQPALAELGAPFAYPGFSVSTSANYFVNVGGKSVFQGTGDVTYQCAAMYTQRAINWDATTKDRVRVTSGKELILSSGTASAPDAKEMSIGTSGAALEPPKFDEADLVDLMLDQATDDLKHVLATTAETTKLRLKLGRKALKVPDLTVWKRLGLLLHALKKKLDAVREKIKAVREKLEAGAKYAKAGADFVAAHKKQIVDGWDAFDHQVEEFKSSSRRFWSEHSDHVAMGAVGAVLAAGGGFAAYKAISKRSAGGGESADGGAAGATTDGAAAAGDATPGGEGGAALAGAGVGAAALAGGLGAAGGGAAGAEAKSAEPAKFKTKALTLDDAKTAVKYLDQAVDEGLHQVETNRKRYDEANKSYEEAAKAYEQLSKDVKSATSGHDVVANLDKHLTNISTMMASGAKMVKHLEDAIEDVGKALDRFAYDMVIGKGKPKMHLVAKHDMELGTSEKLHAYAKKGFDLQTDEGGFMMHTAKGFEVRAMENSAITVKKTLSLESGLGAELASYGPVAVGSRHDDTELLGERLYVGTLTPATAYRKHRQHLIGGASWDEGKQKPTKGVHVMATDEVVLQTGGEKPKGEKSKLEEATPFYLKADKDGKVTLHAKKGGLVRIQIGKYAIEMSDSDLSIGLATSETATPGKAVFGVDHSGGICMMNEAGTCSFDDKSGAFKLKSGSAKVILKSSGTKIDGSKINIG